MELLHILFQNINTRALINIAINSYTSTGKTSVGKRIADQYSYRFIDSELFYQYIKYYDYSIDEVKQIFISTDDDLLEKINSSKNIVETSEYNKPEDELCDLV